ncbi:MAG: hypothetical protein UU73_C0003G0268 [Candidatus Daviesbacteria bacterium GW2011_GWA1_41_61]|uniref:Uncharacterized protein n=1 Tax=Candidatus Daviesbacteria bacterium GW2011_GWA2_40_9 TaxID=1618424 RepID=A0A0G0X4X1_9BACT|nr:MAG: hypothetical protein UU26_C0004G0014 [Candidatus Daviesbacteria bacterium GW2011_GWC1_40_9]KKR82662.1 MAG: hypothetical protein UU29_C0010G0008 [Candidatus Daviesbacteria bacterium GW2011_GWA2_40_9]KKR93382.1 MAG: hypothetical protein UU44_C0002G0043 [Candidatus Daviesbacteria bacterium GW2011_GWB1_41_15]KKS15069.1 MAG: hypothetical protein UU73_C0003G0268 [Candidatus Daviesbacteria bacterium GW2011_GWA1_41_61]
MKIKLLLFILIGLATIGYLSSVTILKDSPQKSVNPKSNTPTQAKVTPTPTPTPLQFNFDSSTDLKKELELINPQIQSDDFKPLEEIIDSLR